jgi:hypothetical protein
MKGVYSRPLAGDINVNIEKFDGFEKWDEFQLKERKRTFFHEMAHALDFINGLFNFTLMMKG